MIPHLQNTCAQIYKLTTNDFNTPKINKSREQRRRILACQRAAHGHINDTSHTHALNITTATSSMQTHPSCQPCNWQHYHRGSFC